MYEPRAAAQLVVEADVAALSLPVPEEFRKFCMFEYVGREELDNPEAYVPILNFIESHPYLSLDTTAADCMGFKEQVGLDDPDITKLLAESFLLNVDAPDAHDLEATLDYQRPVRVEVIDSVSQAAIDNGLTPHNEQARMSRLDSSHVGHAAQRLPPARLGRGQRHASKVDVAIQIYAAVQKWREDKLNHAPNATDRLVLKHLARLPARQPGTSPCLRSLGFGRARPPTGCRSAARSRSCATTATRTSVRSWASAPSPRRPTATSAATSTRWMPWCRTRTTW